MVTAAVKERALLNPKTEAATVRGGWEWRLVRDTCGNVRRREGIVLWLCGTGVVLSLQNEEERGTILKGAAESSTLDWQGILKQ